MKLVLISDVHLQFNFIVPDGDVLICAGDLTWQGRIQEIAEFNNWYNRLHHKRKIVIAGNHDWLFETNPSLARGLLDPSITYLQDSGAVLDPDGHIYPWDPGKQMEGIKIWGSPWQPEFCNWAFNLSRMDNSLKETWEKIPDDTNILVTHGPPQGIHDGPNRIGCFDLRERIIGLKDLKLHVFGHAHSGYGESVQAGIRFINASTCNEHYKPINPPVEIEI